VAQMHIYLQVMSNHHDMTIIGVCVSIGGIGLLAGLAYAIVKYRRRMRGLIGWQDTRPRPFNAPVSASTLPLDANVRIPVLDISRNNSATDVPPQPLQDSRSGPTQGHRETVPLEEAPVRLPAHPRPPQSSGRSGHRQVSDQSHRRSPGRTRARVRRASERSSPSPTPSRLLDREYQTLKDALRPSRSANDLDRAAARSHGRGMTYPRPAPLPPPPNDQRPTHQSGRGPDHSRTPLVNEGTSRIRPYHSASPVVGPGHAAGSSRVQHRDAGPVLASDLPPPYTSS